ncbi:LysM peptidoglycan-binding domain-containing protein [Streptomyces formicae]|uniref:LysM peptidoglycan-binding domain-containing protein n=1 Tax=Streptomyces formicae TaxID=1616117 RepID=A0ABY3WKM4_9ACTN|nr:LysM peptidoglycan-binding domain-containing protein [Streptomyces formicae]UNM13169.1 LysM peptidoglycan-binding domain-containing protein [Streptomyces formicae]
MAHRTPAPLRAVGALLRALLGLALLVALVIGVPYLLLAVGHQPTELSGGFDLLLRQDDGTLFLVVLTCIGWAAWAAFAFSVLVEIVAVLRRRSAPRIKGLGGLQSLASFLIGGIVLLAPTAASAATPSPAVAATAVHTVNSSDSIAASTSTPVSVAAADDAHLPRYTVDSATELPWDLAEEYLGDGTRWKDIAALNPEIPELATGDRFLPQGSIIKLPADARSTATAPSAPEGQPAAAGENDGQGQPREYVVESGDSLSGIAEDQLGDAGQWPELFDENKGERQPYGNRFTDPDLIYPGQSITLPGGPAVDPAQPAPPAAGQGDGGQDQKDTPAPADQDEQPSPDAGGSSSTPEEAGSSAPQESAGDTGPAPAESGASTPTPAASPDDAQPSQAPPSPTSPAQAPPASVEESAGSQAGVLGLAATGVLATGVLSVLAYRRIMQMRRRRRGRHIPLPQAGAARAEHALRVAEAMTDTALLDAVLRTAAVHLTEAERPLPRLAAAVVGDRDIVLHLAEPADPVPPFTADPDHLQRWTCPTGTAELLPEAETDDVDAPYPALVSLGWDPDGRLVLVDLEHIGHLHLTGPARDRVLRTLALELATSEFTHHLDMGLVGGELAPGLDTELPERVTAHDSLRQGLAALRARHDEQQRALAVLDAASMCRARTGVDTAAAWTPYLLLADELDGADEEVLDELQAAVSAEPRSATGLITSGEAPLDLPDGWTLHADPEAGPIRLPLAGGELELDCTLQALSGEDFAYALEILATSRSSDVEAPETVAPVEEQQLAGAVDGDSSGVEAPAGEAVVRTVSAETGAGPGAVPNLLAKFAALDDVDDEQETAGDEPEYEAATMAVDTTAHARQEDDRIDDPGPGLPARAVVGGPVPAQHVPAQAISIRIPDADGVPDRPARSAGFELPDSVPAVALDPVVRVLGTVDITGTRGTTERKRESRSIELAAWLVLHAGSDRHALDEAMWPAGGSRKYRNATVSRLRSWLGVDDDGNAYFPAISTTPDARYSLSPTVGCDWHEFQQLVHTGTKSSGPRANQALRDALDLVRGRPFTSSDRSRYRWAEHLALVMVMDIVDAADLLAERCLAARDPRSALWAATKGLMVAPEVESLYRILFRAYAAIGDYEALEGAAQKLRDFNEQNDLETEEDTLAVLDELMARPA